MDLPVRPRLPAALLVKLCRYLVARGYNPTHLSEDLDVDYALITSGIEVASTLISEEVTSEELLERTRLEAIGVVREMLFSSNISAREKAARMMVVGMMKDHKEEEGEELTKVRAEIREFMEDVRSRFVGPEVDDPDGGGDGTSESELGSD